MDTPFAILPQKLPSEQADTPFFQALNDGKKRMPNTGFGVRLVFTNATLGEAFMLRFGQYHFPFSSVYLSEVGHLNGKGTAGLIPMLHESLEQDGITILIGAESAIAKTCFDALQFAEQPFIMSMVQSSVGAEHGLDTLLMDLRQPWLHRLHLIATQAHHCRDQFLEDHIASGLYHHRLGRIRGDLAVTEPEIRSADILAIDLNALKYGDAPCQQTPSSIGLLNEETCQLGYYGGRADRNRLFCLYGFDEQKLSELGIDLLTSLTWYFLHGLQHRNTLYPPLMSQLNTFLLDVPVADMQLTFYKDERSQKWWLNNPFHTTKLAKRFPLLACDYQDYALAANESLLSNRLESLLDQHRKAPSMQE